ncbi:hypothetical protein VTL71DRAFT_14872 [Oculimacula yallundae]|uniref:Uncharacterized protein n=1 Tax=Oculimacula yallundae TaxID=86028 RepID=A0ABR4CF08_9HELO
MSAVSSTHELASPLAENAVAVNTANPSSGTESSGKATDVNEQEDSNTAAVKHLNGTASVTENAQEQLAPRVMPVELSERSLGDELNCGEEILQGMVEGFHKYQEKIQDLDYKPKIDFDAIEINTIAELYDHIGQRSYNAGYKQAMKDAAELQRLMALRAGRRAEEMSGWEGIEGWKEVQMEVEEDHQVTDDEEDEEQADDEGESQSVVPGKEIEEELVDGDQEWDNEEDLYSADTPPPKRKADFFDNASIREQMIKYQASKKTKLNSGLASVANNFIPEVRPEVRPERDEVGLPYHEFGPVEGLYGTRLADSDAPIPVPIATVPTTVRKLTRKKPASRRLDDSDSEEEEQSVPAKKARPDRAVTKTKKSRLFLSSNQNEDPQAKDARMWFLDQAKAMPLDTLPIGPQRAGAKGRKYGSKKRGDWGTPRPRAVSKAQFQAVRKHGKYTTNAYINKGPSDTYSLPLTHREARRYENMPISNGYTHFFERGDYSEEDPLIDGRLIKFELGHFQAIREGKILRRERLAAGENQDDESSLSDDDSQYDSDRATCGWDLVQLKAIYDAKAKARALAKGKGKGKAVDEYNDGSAEEDEVNDGDADDETDGNVGEQEEEDGAEEGQGGEVDVFRAREDTPESQQSEAE